ncbi:hypothetical protein GGD66_002261 [Bradyrhizobium sp. CIR48]|nr:hypothetical protein [Bradyrhizobium sp. ERR14]MBB4423717.1 hypothetical protein [Bradyrhizobium sp. CIR48]
MLNLLCRGEALSEARFDAVLLRERIGRCFRIDHCIPRKFGVLKLRIGIRSPLWTPSWLLKASDPLSLSVEADVAESLPFEMDRSCVASIGSVSLVRLQSSNSLFMRLTPA